MYTMRMLPLSAPAAAVAGTRGAVAIAFFVAIALLVVLLVVRAMWHQHSQER